MKSIIVHLSITLTIFTLTSGKSSKIFVLPADDCINNFATPHQHIAGATRSEDCSDLSARRCFRTRGCEWGRDRCFAGSGDFDTNEQVGRCHHLSEIRCTRTPGCDYDEVKGCIPSNNSESSTTENTRCPKFPMRKCVRHRGCDWKNNRCVPGSSGGSTADEQAEKCIFLSERHCKKAKGCEWGNDGCVRTNVQVGGNDCYDLKKGECKAQGCFWDKINKACRPEPPRVVENCFGLKKSKCNQAKRCYWDRHNKRCMSVLRDVGQLRWPRG